jgi:ubiquinone biosynthesis protein
MQIQPQLVLLQKTLLNIEGLGRQLYPELDLWKTAQPILKRWMRERISPRTLLKQVRAQLPDSVEALKQLPQLFNTAVREAAEGRLRWQLQSAQIEDLRLELRANALRRDVALAAAALWLSGFVWLAVAMHLRWLGWLQLIAAAGLVLWLKASKPGWRRP